MKKSDSYATTAQTSEVRSPYNSELLANFSLASLEEVEESIAAASRAAVEMRPTSMRRWMAVAELWFQVRACMVSMPSDFDH